MIKLWNYEMIMIKCDLEMWSWPQVCSESIKSLSIETICDKKLEINKVPEMGPNWAHSPQSLITMPSALYTICNRSNLVIIVPVVINKSGDKEIALVSLSFSLSYVSLVVDQFELVLKYTFLHQLISTRRLNLMERTLAFVFWRLEGVWREIYLECGCTF